MFRGKHLSSIDHECYTFKYHKEKFLLSVTNTIVLEILTLMASSVENVQIVC